MSESLVLPCDIVEGDIGEKAVAEGPWLAVVSSDDNYLSHGGGCSRSLWRAAKIDSVDKLGVAVPIQLGDVIVTAAGALPTAAIFHVVTLDLDTRQSMTPDLFELVMLMLSEQVKDARLKSPKAAPKVLLPLLGTGAAGVAERIAVEQLARLAVLTQEAGVRCVVCVPAEVARIRNAFINAFGLVSPCDVLETWLKSLRGETARRSEALTRALDVLLSRVVSAVSQHDGLALGLRGMWNALRATTSEAAGLHESIDRRRVEDAVGLRNRLVHGVTAPDAITCLTLEIGLRALVSLSSRLTNVPQADLRDVLGKVAPQALESGSRPLEEENVAAGPGRFPGNAGTTTHKLLCVTNFHAPKSPAVPSGGGGPSLSGHRAEHVDRLVELLLSLPPDELAHVADTLAELGYKGDLRLQIKEYCVRQDPVAILAQFGAVRLKKILAEKFSEPVPAKKSPKWMSRRLLHHLGFRIPGNLRSLEAVINDVSRLESELLTDDARALVIKASAKLEGCIHDLLRFICLHLFSHGPEQHFKGHVNGAAAVDMSKATLGSLLHCLELLARELEQCARDDSKKVLRELQGPLTARRLAPGGLGTISKLRNTFAHFDDDAGDAEDAEAAREFFRGAKLMLRHWADDTARIYPVVIRIEKIIVDEWNRRRIQAVTAEGRKELIVCDKAVEPGGTYFMYPLSNPFRVDPILIEFSPQ